MKPIYTGTDWTPKLLAEMWKVIADVCEEELGLTYYEPQMEIITYEHMLNCYSSVGMPNMYKHWSFGKSFIQNEREYRTGRMGLAYELVINSDPMVTYLMENNSMTMQTLVMAHAVCGHGSFFKNNYLFKEWTDADLILDYLKYAEEFVTLCEKQYGQQEVEDTLDACHSLQDFAVDKYKKQPPLSEELAKMRRLEEAEQDRKHFNDLWRTVPQSKEISTSTALIRELLKDKESFQHARRAFRTELSGLVYPSEENVLKFIAENSPSLESWQREICHIVCRIAQYFYPQSQTKMMNEGWASFVHHHIMTSLLDRGYITDGAYLEFIDSHCGVTYQPAYQHLNPYALGFNMYKDIKRICQEPTKEDAEWFPNLAGTPWLPALKEAYTNYRDESFILQYLSPKLARDMKLATYKRRPILGFVEVQEVHSNEDFKELRTSLSNHFNRDCQVPQLDVIYADMLEDRALTIRYTPRNHVKLDNQEYDAALRQLRYLWGYEVDISYNNDEIYGESHEEDYRRKKLLGI